jgi:hypothetical protein
MMKDDTAENSNFPENAPRGSGSNQMGDKMMANKGV